MRPTKSIQLKAAFLLLVFAFNTALAFACSLGLNMGYNNEHHQHAVAVKKHSSAHRHHSSGHGDDKSGAGKNDCCSANALEFQKENKKLQQTPNCDIKAPVFVAFLSAFLGFELAPETLTTENRNLIPQYCPPPPDIRITIQSFQI